MFLFNDKFLEEVGLGELSREQRDEFLTLLRSQLEERVGEKLYDGLSDEQVTEFESIIDKNEDVINKWLADNAPDYKDDKIFKAIAEARQLPEDSTELKIEYTSTKWIEKNRTDYQKVVADEMSKLREEVANNKDLILGQNKAN